jgi:hypothetical protein
MKLLRFAVAAGLASASLMSSAVPPTDRSAYNGFDVSDALIDVADIERGGPPKDGIPAIDRPRFVAAAAARLQADDRILGLAYNGIERAYPVRILNWHEVVNDRFGDAPVAITYCPLCGTGMAFDARLGGRELNFGVSGLLYNSDVLLYDRASQSLWSQLKQLAVSGPLKGRQLTALPLEHTSWADWRSRHPATEVLSTDTGHVRDYGRDPYAGYERVERLMFNVEHRDDRRPLKEWVLGIRVNGVRKAYPFSALERATREAGANEFVDRVGGRTIIVRYDGEHRSARALDGERQPLPGVMAFWFAWVAFYPQTEVYRLAELMRKRAAGPRRKIECGRAGARRPGLGAADQAAVAASGSIAPARRAPGWLLTQLLSMHSRSRMRARNSITLQWLAVTPSVRQISSVSQSSHSRIRKARPCASGSRAMQSCSTSKNCFCDSDCSGSPHSSGAATRLPVSLYSASSEVDSSDSAPDSIDTSRACRRNWSTILCFRMPTTHVRSCERPSKRFALSMAAIIVSETTSSAQL